MLEWNKCHKIDVLIGLSSLSDASADIEIIDPPYNIGKNFGNNSDKMSPSEYIEWSKMWIAQSLRVLKDTGTGYIYGFSEILACLFPKIKANKRWLVWHYTNKNAASNKFWQRSHESIICFWKSKQMIFNQDDVREDYTETFLKNAAGKKRAATKGRFSKTDKETIYKAHEKGALPRDVIKISALAGGAGRKERFFYCKQCNALFTGSSEKEHEGHGVVKHPTQKPYRLTEKLITASKPKTGGCVVVPFAGTGTEIYVAQHLGMEAIGFDINGDYVNMANLLIERGYPQKNAKPSKIAKETSHHPKGSSEINDIGTD